MFGRLCREVWDENGMDDGGVSSTSEVVVLLPKLSSGWESDAVEASYGSNRTGGGDDSGDELDRSRGLERWLGVLSTPSLLKRPERLRSRLKSGGGDERGDEERMSSLRARLRSLFPDCRSGRRGLEEVRLLQSAEGRKRGVWFEGVLAN